MWCPCPVHTIAVTHTPPPQFPQFPPIPPCTLPDPHIPTDFRAKLYNLLLTSHAQQVLRGRQQRLKFGPAEDCELGQGVRASVRGEWGVGSGERNGGGGLGFTAVRSLCLLLTAQLEPGQSLSIVE